MRWQHFYRLFAFLTTFHQDLAHKFMLEKAPKTALDLMLMLHFGLPQLWKKNSRYFQSDFALAITFKDLSQIPKNS